MTMKSWFSTKKRIAAVGLTGAVILGSAGIALAFIPTGSGTGSATAGVTPSASWSVVIGTESGGPLNSNPGTGSPITVQYTVTNASTSAQTLTSVTASLNVLGGLITSGGSVRAGCWELAGASNQTALVATPSTPVGNPGVLGDNWFTVTNNPPTPGLIGAGDTVAGNFVIAMPLNPAQNQGACGGAMPDFTVTAS
jgi:hypothetical protein